MLQLITDITEICAQKGITRAVISPGSRSAPLTLSFARHPKIETYIIPDERSAAFIALGMAQKLDEAVVLICTSGSAVYNYAPAVAEAFYNQVPLVVFSADRPPEWVDQQDGQTIRQPGIFGKHVWASYELPDTLSHQDQAWHGHRMVNEAINTALESKGPVHINVPLREPFYPPPGESLKPSRELRVIENMGDSRFPGEGIPEELASFKKILVVVGQNFDHSFHKALDDLSRQYHLPVVADIISNCGHLQNAILHQDLFLPNASDSLRPDLLLTFGKSVISKNLKLFLRKHQPHHHWHVGSSAMVADTFKSLTRVIRHHPSGFIKGIKKLNTQSDYLESWLSKDQLTGKLLTGILNEGFWEFSAVKEVIQALPEKAHLHLANSMPVRWANFIGNSRKDVTVYANRGTSGIDGCLSTAVGCALSTEEPVIAVLGDMSFLYDRNGLWHNYLPENLRIIILNNHGGGIFRLIEGPARQPELEEYFETRQLLTAQNTLRDHDISYTAASNRNELLKALPDLFKMSDKRVKALEVFTDSSANQQELASLKKAIKKI